MLSCFDRIPVKPGDCFIVPAGTPHAIGAGIFMMELQEPTDWVVRCEQVNAGLRLPPEACFMGLDLERCLEVFNYNEYSVEQVFRLFRQKPRVTRQNSTFVEEEIISPEHKEFFRLHHVRGTEGCCTIPGGELMLMVVLKGQGMLSAGRSDQRFSSGETWLLPGSADSWDIRGTGTPWDIMIARLPEEPDPKPKFA
jgi:mannose-6-phosphate isomerase